MLRLSIDITPEKHQKLKDIAALKGQSIKEYVLNRTLSESPDLAGMTEEEAFDALSGFLKPRIEQARRGQLSSPLTAGTFDREDLRRSLSLRWNWNFTAGQ